MSDITPVISDDHNERANSQQRTQSDKKTRHIKGSIFRIKAIAEKHGLDAMISEDTPSKSLFERALLREKQRKELRQKNLELILKVALDSCQDEIAGEPDHDWLLRFLDLAQDIHNHSMQKLWAQVLKREVTKPGSTSLKALKVLKNMTPNEAQTLQKAASLACSFGSDNSKKLLLGIKSHTGFFLFSRRESVDALSLGEFQLPYSSLLILVELGIVLGTELESGVIEIEPALKLSYQGKEYTLQPKSKGTTMTYYRFTPTGNELCQLLGNRSNPRYQEKLVELLNRKFQVQSDVRSHFYHKV